MSVENTAIEGDFAVGRHLTVGGDTTIHGKTHHKGSLKVDGWFEAPNIIGVNKGLFTTPTLLVGAYPTPQPGWYALVGESLPADVYVVEDGVWVPTGGVSDSNGSNSSEQLVELQERTTALEAADTELQNNLTTLETNLTENISSLETELMKADTSLANSIGRVDDSLQLLEIEVNNKITALETADTELQNNLTTLETNLTDEAMELRTAINGRMNSVIPEYSLTMTAKPGTIIDDTYSGSYGEIIYIESTKRFLCKVTKDSSGADLSTPEYYSTWTGYEDYGLRDISTDTPGIIPSETTLYYMGGFLRKFNGLVFGAIADNAYNSYSESGGTQSRADYLLRLAKFIDNQSAASGSTVMATTEYGTLDQIMGGLINNTAFIAALKRVLGIS